MKDESPLLNTGAYVAAFLAGVAVAGAVVRGIAAILSDARQRILEKLREEKP